MFSASLWFVYLDNLFLGSPLALQVDALALQADALTLQANALALQVKMWGSFRKLLYTYQ